MIIPVFGIETLADYEQWSKSSSDCRPEKCPGCGKMRVFWKHGSYVRKVLETTRQVDVVINRFKCKHCGLVVSCLFAFLIPYRRFAAHVVANSVESYMETNASYRQVAGEMSDLYDDQPPKPSHSQIFHAVNALQNKISALLFQLQKELVMRGRDGSLPATLPGLWTKATRKADKQGRLAQVLEFNQLVRIANNTTCGALRFAHAFFFSSVESLQSIFSRREVRLPTPHSVKHLLF